MKNCQEQYSQTYVLALGLMMSLFFRTNQTLYWVAKLAWAAVRCRSKKFVRDIFQREEADEELIREEQGAAILSQKLLNYLSLIFDQQIVYALILHNSKKRLTISILNAQSA